MVADGTHRTAPRLVRYCDRAGDPLRERWRSWAWYPDSPRVRLAVTPLCHAVAVARGGSRSGRDVVLKKLFALSRNRCAFPVCEELLSQPRWPNVKAEICHVAGLNEGSARYDPAMTPEKRSAYENLLLFCPNHDTLVDDLEPERFTVDDLSDMKLAHEAWRPGDVEWCTENAAAQFVVKLVHTHGVVVLEPGEQPRQTIRSGTPMPPQPSTRRPLEDDEERQPVRPNWARPSEERPDWPRGRRRVRDLGGELGLAHRTVLELHRQPRQPAQLLRVGAHRPRGGDHHGQDREQVSEYREVRLEQDREEQPKDDLQADRQEG